MTESVRDYEGALAYARAQNAHRSQDWTGMCQKFVRLSYAIGGGFGSAYAQWLGAPAHSKHAGGSSSSAPVGAALFYKGSGKNGHIMLAAKPFASGTHGAWSTDLWKTGQVGKVARTAPTSAWHQKYLGYTTNLNGVDLDLTHGAPPKPKQVHYKNIADSIEQLEGALGTAKQQKDAADVKILTAEIAHLKSLYATLRRNA